MRLQRVKSVFRSIIITGFVLLLCDVAGIHAGQYTVTPSLSLVGGYDDNLNFTSWDETADLFTELKPAAVFRRSMESSSVAGTAELNFQSYANETHLNTVDQKYSIAGDYLPVAELKLDLSGSYLEDTSLDTEFSTEGLIMARTDRRKYGTSGAAAWSAGYRTAFNLAGGYDRTEYDDDDSRYSDYYVESLSAGVSHQLRNGRTVLVLQPSYSYYGFDTGNTKNYQALLGLNHNLSENSSLQLFAGPNYSRSESWVVVPLSVPPFTERVERVEDQSGWLASMEAKRISERGSMRAGYTRDITGSSYGVTLKRDHPYLAFSLSLSERLRSRLSFDYYRTRSEWQETLYDNETYSVGTGITYSLRERAEISLNYAYSRINNRLGDRGERNRVYLQLNLFTVKEL
ncbi:MAG: outer membrane beta-barrel protein [Pseudomonadota bacterium]